MTLEQGIVLGVIVGIFGLFAWGKWRYDIVAVIGLFSLVVADVIVVKVLRREDSALIDPESALAGFGHPAVITVAAVLVISRALRNSGVVDLITRQLAPFAKNQTLLNESRSLDQESLMKMKLCQSNSKPCQN